MKPYVPFILIPVVGYGVRLYLSKTGRWDRVRRMSLVLSLLFFCLTEIGRSFYRPYVYSHGWTDFGIADTVGNSFGTATAVFFITTVAGKGNRKDFLLQLFVVLGLVAYEASNVLSDHPVDGNDIVATLVFGALSILLYALILRGTFEAPPPGGLTKAGSS